MHRRREPRELSRWRGSQGRAAAPLLVRHQARGERRAGRGAAAAANRLRVRRPVQPQRRQTDARRVLRRAAAAIRWCSFPRARYRETGVPPLSCRRIRSCSPCAAPSPIPPPPPPLPPTSPPPPPPPPSSPHKPATGNVRRLALDDDGLREPLHPDSSHSGHDDADGGCQCPGPISEPKYHQPESSERATRPHQVQGRDRQCEDRGDGEQAEYRQGHDSDTRWTRVATLSTPCQAIRARWERVNWLVIGSVRTVTYGS